MPGNIFEDRPEQSARLIAEAYATGYLHAFLWIAAWLAIYGDRRT